VGLGSVLLTKYCLGDQMEEVKTCGACSAYGPQESNIFTVLLRKPEGKRPFGKPRHRWEGTIKMDLREI
jgi:hypothetical protein